jgi:starch synthase
MDGWLLCCLFILKHYYKDEGIFAETKIISSVYDQGFEGELDKEFINKVLFDNISNEAVSDLASPTYENLMKVSIMHSDAIVAGSEVLSPTLTKFIESSNKPFLPFASKETIKEVYTSFIKNHLL